MNNWSLSCREDRFAQHPREIQPLDCINRFREANHSLPFGMTMASG